MDHKANDATPRHDSDRRRIESRYIKEPGRPRIKISHRRGSEYHRRSTYSAQHFDQILNSRLSHTEPIKHRYAGRVRELRRPRPVKKYDYEESTHLNSEDSEHRDERSLPLSFNFFDPYEEFQESLAQTSLLSLDRGRIRGSKTIVGDESKTYRERIIDVSSSRYINISDSGRRCGAELISQRPAGESERDLQPLLNWM